MTATPPLFSIIIAFRPGEDGAQFLPRALDSLWRQSCQNFEIVLCHAGPLPPEFDPPSHLRLARCTLAAAADDEVALRQAGLARAVGEYVINLKSEDVLYDFALERIVRMLETPRRRIEMEESGRFRRAADELAPGDEADILIFAILNIGVECDGEHIWTNARYDRRHAMLLSGRPAMDELLECMQVVVRRSMWLAQGGWSDPAPNGHALMHCRLIDDSWARCIPAVLGEHWG